MHIAVSSLTVCPGTILFVVDGMQYSAKLEGSYKAGVVDMYIVHVTRIPVIKSRWTVGERITIHLPATTAHDAGMGSL